MGKRSPDKGRSKDPALKPGDLIRVRFGRRMVEGRVTSVRNGRVHVELDVEGAEEPIAGLYRESDLVSA